MIHLIITTANIQENYALRKEQYLKSINQALKFNYLLDSYTILECSSYHEDYLNSYNTYYSKIGNKFPEKGLNEMQHLKSFIEQSSINSTDTIIKLTGRYLLEDSTFINKVILLTDFYDSFFKDDSDIYEGKGYHTFLYAMKKNRFLETINSLNFSKTNLDPIEWGVKDFLKNKNRNYLLKRLGIIAIQGTYGEKVFNA
ncbi:hypothetical protein [Pedobacter sp. MW01-1-1]|uniref:hypothetical protein n=1 Tax=Pedobacter sp. MW01-1-1 TaxID=3383027 RepID=UPI003FF13A2C